MKDVTQATPVRRVLLCVLGTSPAVITETLYALCKEDPPFIPDELHVITTLQGKRKVLEELVQPTSGQFHKLMQDHLVGHRIRFDEETVHVIQNEHGPLSDIVTEEDNRAAGDSIYRLMRLLKLERPTSLHASVAGGRKSMSFYMGHSFSLLADFNDRLTHVLVSEPYERVRGFYYPTPHTLLLKCHDGSMIDAAEAKVTLADLSVLRMGPTFKEHWPKSVQDSFEEAVELAQQVLSPPTMHLSISEKGRGQVRVGKRVFELTPKEFGVLAAFSWARKHADDLPDGAGIKWDDFDSPYWNMVSGQLEGLRYDPAKEKMDYSNVTTKIKNTFKENLGPVHEHFQIKKKMGKKSDLYELTTDPSLIEIELPPAWRKELQQLLT